MDAHSVGRLEAVRGAVEMRRGGDEGTRHDAFGHDLPGAVDIGQEHLQRSNPLGHTLIDGPPLVRGDDPGDEVHR